MVREFDAVVIGAGALGASTAFHLVAQGFGRIALIDKHAAASQTSPRAAGLTQQLRATEALTLIAARSTQKIIDFTAETGQPMECFRGGSVKLARRPEHVDQLREEVERAKQWGIDLRWFESSRLPELSPFIHPDGVLAATYNPHDLYLEPGQVPRGYVRAAVALGVELIEHTVARRIIVENGAVAGVELADEDIRSPVVVDAAGAWSRLFAATADVRPAIVPTRHQLLITEPLDGVKPDQPIVRIIDANVYVRPDRGGLMLGGYESDPEQYPSPPDDIAELTLDLQVLRGLADQVREQMPVFQDVFARGAIREHRGGLPTVSPDGRLLLGPVTSLPGLYLATGCNVGGLSASPGIGAVLADLIATGRSSVGDVSDLSPDRFGPEFLDERRLREATRHRYAHQYSPLKTEEMRGAP